MIRTHRRDVVEACISAAIALALAMLVFGPLLAHLAAGWAGGDMLSTYANADVWGGFGYRVEQHYGYPFGMNLNYFPGIDITENVFASVVTGLVHEPFVGVNLLVIVSFPLAAALAYAAVRMTGLRGPLAIVLAVTFSLIPYHWGRALGHTYLSTLYSMLTGALLVLIVGGGYLERWYQQARQVQASPAEPGAGAAEGHGRGRAAARLVLIVVLVLVTAWTGVYYAAFTLILGLAAVIWRVAMRARWTFIVLDLLPFIGIVIAAAIGFLPSLLTRGDAPLASLGERTPIESVTYAGNLAVALLPLPQSLLPGLGAYNAAVVEAIGAAPWGESTAITNHGTWITSIAAVVLIIGLIVRSRGRLQPDDGLQPRVTLGFVAYLTVVTLAFFVPWGLNYLVAGTLTAQIRGWNRLLPFLLLFFLLGAAAVAASSRWSKRPGFIVPICIVVLGLVVVDSVLPFRTSYLDSVSQGAASSDAGRAYAIAVNDAIPGDCGVLQLPYLPYPEAGVIRGLYDYEHFWPALTNRGKSWSYGAVRNTDASVWAAQLPQTPSVEQIALLRGAGFCAIHVDTRGYLGEEVPVVLGDLTTKLGPPAATGADGNWQLFAIPQAADAAQWTSEVTDFFRQAMITADPATAGERMTMLDHSWWWTVEGSSDFTLTPINPDAPLQVVTGAVQAPPCGPLPITVSVFAGKQAVSTTVVARPDTATPFRVVLTDPTSEPAVVSVTAPGPGCDVPGLPGKRHVQVLDLLGVGPAAMVSLPRP